MKQDAKIAVLAALLPGLVVPGGVSAQDCTRQSEYFIDHWMQARGLTDWFGDPDGDGVPNYVEFGFGLDPFSAAPGQGMDYVQPRIRLNAQGKAEIVMLQPDLPCYTSGFGRPWFWIWVEETTDLREWRYLMGGNGAINPQEGWTATYGKRPQGDWQITLTEQAPATGRKWFRLKFLIIS